MMREYIEKILHQDVQITPYEDNGRLPLVCRSCYELYLITIGGYMALLAAPLEKLPLVTLRKQQHQMTMYTGLTCVLYLKEINYYTREALLKEGIPFVWEGHQIYLPFIGILLDDNKREGLPNCTQISFLTQRLLLTALYEGWQQVTVTKAAVMLNVSKMSITRCFDELEALNTPVLSVRNRARKISVNADKKAAWESIHGFLRNPVIEYYSLKDVPDMPLPLSGESALSYYSMLDDGPYPVLAITKKDLKDIDLSNGRLVPAGEEPACIVQKLGYRIPYGNGTAIDPLTVALSISDDEKSDPRINMAIDEMLEEYVW